MNALTVRGRVLFSLLAGLLLSLTGCGPAHEVSSPSSDYTATRDGGFSYRIPSGWFDASADSQARGHSALIIRNDYGATIVIDEVRLDDAARTELQRNGLVPLARLLVSLTTGERDAILTSPPQLATAGDRQFCRYGMTSGNAEDTSEIALVENRGRLYTIKVLMTGKGGGDVKALRLLQNEFLGAIHW